MLAQARRVGTTQSDVFGELQAIWEQGRAAWVGKWGWASGESSGQDHICHNKNLKFSRKQVFPNLDAHYKDQVFLTEFSKCYSRPIKSEYLQTKLVCFFLTWAMSSHSFLNLTRRKIDVKIRKEKSLIILKVLLWNFMLNMNYMEAYNSV